MGSEKKIAVVKVGDNEKPGRCCDVTREQRKKPKKLLQKEKKRKRKQDKGKENKKKNQTSNHNKQPKPCLNACSLYPKTPCQWLK